MRFWGAPGTTPGSLGGPAPFLPGNLAIPDPGKMQSSSVALWHPLGIFFPNTSFIPCSGISFDGASAFPCSLPCLGPGSWKKHKDGDPGKGGEGHRDGIQALLISPHPVFPVFFPPHRKHRLTRTQSAFSPVVFSPLFTGEDLGRDLWNSGGVFSRFAER